MNEERKRILQMLAEGQITAEEAAELIEALGDTPRADAELRPGGPARLLRIYVHDPEDATEVKVNLPLALARFALKFIPEEQRAQIAEAGFDLDELLASLKSETPEGRLVELEQADGTRVIIEVV
ncbi:SHOCT-like domain-containing protein [Deinococcota bacterium DY0809b]